MKIFIEVGVNRIDNPFENEYYYMTNRKNSHWAEGLKLPSEEEIKKEVQERYPEYNGLEEDFRNSFKEGARYILEFLKK